MKLNYEEIKKLVIFPDTSLKSAMAALSAGRGKVLFVIDDREKLIGSVTDGDIRRAILNGMGFDDLISKIMFKSPRFVRRSDQGFETKVKRYVIEEKLYSVPVVDERDRIVDILFWHDFFESHPLEVPAYKAFSNPVVIMAGGKGMRLDPFTKILPKPLIPFGNKSIIEKIMDSFNECGFSNFILTLNYRKELIKLYLKENQFPYNVDWVEEDEYLGTAGSIGLLKDRIKETFFVCNCDTLLENDFRNILAWHKGEKALMTLIGYHKELVLPYGTLQVDKGYLNAINEKPKFDMIINTGVYIIEPEIFSLVSTGKRLEMNHLIERAIKKGRVTVYPVCEGWFDIGQWKEYKESLHLLQNSKEKIA